MTWLNQEVGHILNLMILRGRSVEGRDAEKAIVKRQARRSAELVGRRKQRNIPSPSSRKQFAGDVPKRNRGRL